MGIPMNATCLACRVNRVINTVKPIGTEEQTTAFLKKLFGKISQYPANIDSARCGYYTDRMFEEFYGFDPAELNKTDREVSNRFVLERLDMISSRIEAAADPVYAALQFSVLGNYLDFAALAGKVSFQELEKMLDGAKDIDLDREEYRQFLKDLDGAQTLLYITDNAGEIGFDRVLAEVLHTTYPHLQITFCVRGAPVANDATREDAAAVGIEFPVIDSGVAVGGTAIDMLSPEAKQALEAADVVLAKGMGNTESMYGCGYNVYYAFLVKCQRFAEVFQKPLMAPMFVRDRKDYCRGGS